jgi:hypothetical protein
MSHSPVLLSATSCMARPFRQLPLVRLQALQGSALLTLHWTLGRLNCKLTSARRWGPSWRTD